MSSTHVHPVLRADVREDWPAWLASQRDALRGVVAEHGAAVIRGLGLSDPAAVGRAVAALSEGTMTDLEAFAGRDRHPAGVYSSSAWPPTQQMCMHHELSYRLEFPRLMFFACIVAPTEGGTIGLADSTAVLRALPEPLVDRFNREGWMLVRNYTEEIGLSTAEAFGTDDRTAIEHYCRANSIDVDWRPDGVRTRQRRRAIVRHPGSGRLCWFNQIAFLSEWTLNPEVRDFLIEMYGPDGLPFTTCYGNGDPVEEDVVQLINDVYDDNTSYLTLAAGDLVVVDNIGRAHCREPYVGDREVLVAMADPIRLADVEVGQ